MLEHWHQPQLYNPYLCIINYHCLVGFMSWSLPHGPHLSIHFMILTFPLDLQHKTTTSKSKTFPALTAPRSMPNAFLSIATINSSCNSVALVWLLYSVFSIILYLLIFSYIFFGIFRTFGAASTLAFIPRILTIHFIYYMYVYFNLAHSSISYFAWGLFYPCLPMPPLHQAYQHTWWWWQVDLWCGSYS